MDKRFDEAIKLLPAPLRDSAAALTDGDKQRAEELRFRVGQAPSLLLPEGERGFSPIITDQPLMRSILDIATESSVHTAAGSIRHGFITAKGGFRVGLSGSAIVQDGKCVGFHSLNSLCIRISREKRGIASPVAAQLGGARHFPSVLVLSPPGAGKTTFLRDMVRLLSCSGRRVALCDERGEIAAMISGKPQMDVGPCTDVMEGCPRAQAMEMMLRTMNPQILAADEITAGADMEALINAAGCGVTLLATAHAADIQDLKRRPMYSELMRERIFDAAVIVRMCEGVRRYSVVSMRELND